MDVLLENNKQVIRKFLKLKKEFMAGGQIEGKQLSDLLRNTAEILHFLSKTNTSEDEILKGREQCLEMLRFEVAKSDPKNQETLPEHLEKFLLIYEKLLGGMYKEVKS